MMKYVNPTIEIAHFEEVATAEVAQTSAVTTLYNQMTAPGNTYIKVFIAQKKSTNVAQAASIMSFKE